MREQLRKISIDELLWGLVLASYVGLFGYLLFSDRLRELMHPRMTVFVLIGFVILLFFAGFQLAGAFSVRATKRQRPAIALFLLPFISVPFFLTSSVTTLAAADKLAISQVATAAPHTPSAAAAALIPAAGTIVLNETNYYAVYNAIYDNPQKYAGRRVTVSGFAYRDAPNLGTGEFVTARELMWCCAADASIIGFITRMPPGTLPLRDDWVSVSGTLSVTSFRGPNTDSTSSVPLLTVDLLQHMESPDFSYVYPVF